MKQMVSFIRALTPFMRAYDVITSPKPHFQTPSHLGIRFQCWRDTNIQCVAEIYEVYSRVVLLSFRISDVLDLIIPLELKIVKMSVFSLLISRSSVLSKC